MIPVTHGRISPDVNLERIGIRRGTPVGQEMCALRQMANEPSGRQR
jgi:hypothetical protein